MKYIKFLLLSIIVLSCNNSCENNKENASQDVDDDIKMKEKSVAIDNYELIKISEVNFGEALNVSGTIDVPPQNKSVISTYVGGYVAHIPMLVGDKVKKGQLVVSLQNPEYVELQQNYLEVSEQLIYLKSEYERQKTLFDENITSEKSFLKAQSQYKSNLAHYQGLKKTLEMLNIKPKQIASGNIVSTINLYAPIDGFISEVNVRNGAYISPNDAILEIVNTEHIHLELSVFEKDIMKVKQGQKIKFKIPEASDTVFEGNVHIVGSTVDETTRRVKVHGHVDNKSNQFIIGMYVNAAIMLSEKLAYGLPSEALLQDESGNYVLIIDNDAKNGITLKKLNVSTGRKNENHTEIINGQRLWGKEIAISKFY